MLTKKKAKKTKKKLPMRVARARPGAVPRTPKRRKSSPTSSGVRYPDRYRERAVILAQKGLSVPEITRKLNGPSQKTVRDWLLVLGIDPNPGRCRRHDREKVLADLQARLSNGKLRYTRRQICEKYGCSAKYLSQLAKGDLKP